MFESLNEMSQISRVIMGMRMRPRYNYFVCLRLPTANRLASRQVGKATRRTANFL